MRRRPLGPRRLLISDRKIDSSKLSMQSTRRFVVNARSLFFGDESAEPNLFSVAPNSRRPFIVVSRYALIFRRYVQSLFAIAVVFGRSRFSQIVSSIVEPVSVLVINPLSLLRLHNMAMKKDCGVSPFLVSAHAPKTTCGVFSTCPINPELPIPSAHIRKIDFIYLRERASCERHEPNAKLRRRNTNNTFARSCRLGAYGSKLTGTFGPTRTLRGIAIRRLVRRAAQNTHFLVQSHCSTPYTSSSQAPVGYTTRGYLVRKDNTTCAAV